MSNEEPRKETTPKAKEEFSNPNELSEAIKDLEDYENYTNTDNLFQSEKGDRLVVEKHEPYEDAKKAKKVKASAEDLKNQHEHRDVFDEDNFNKGLLTDPKEIDELLESEEAYSKHLDINQ